MSFAVWLRDLERLTRPVVRKPPLPWMPGGAVCRTRAHAVPSLGQHAVGCEGTHGGIPKCNLACTPCYHSRDANRVAVSGSHTQREVRAQMGLLRRVRGPRAQLIGGEVSLLPPDHHARRCRSCASTAVSR